MTRRFIVRPLAEADLEDAARWYEDERAGLVERFLSDVDRTIARLRERPFQFPAVSGGCPSRTAAGRARDVSGALTQRHPVLNEVKRRRMLDRVMFGSDQMRWPEAIALAIDRVNRLDFLTVKEKAHIFCDNAAKSLGLPAEEIARHHR